MTRTVKKIGYLYELFYTDEDGHTEMIDLRVENKHENPFTDFQNDADYSYSFVSYLRCYQIKTYEETTHFTTSDSIGFGRKEFYWKVRAIKAFPATSTSDSELYIKELKEEKMVEYYNYY